MQHFRKKNLQIRKNKTINVKSVYFENINSGIHFFCKKNNKKHQRFWKMIRS